LFLLLLAFALRLSGLTAQSLWRDEVDALRFSETPLRTLTSNFRRPGWNGPLYYVLLRAWLTLAGRSEFALRYFSLCFGVLSVALLYRLGRAWCSPLVGGLAGLLLACSAYMVWYAQEAKMYALLCALVIAVLYLYRQALTTEDRWLWTHVVMLTWVTVSVHVLGALLIPVMVALFFVWWRMSREHWRAACLALVACVLPGAISLPWAFPLLVRGADLGHRYVSLGGMVATMLTGFSRGVRSAGGLWPLGVALFALLAAAWLEVDRAVFSPLDSADQGPKLTSARGNALGGPLFVLTCWVWFAVPILGLYAITLRVPMFVDRYLIWIGPAFYLLVARGLDRLRRRAAALAVGCLVAILAFGAWGVWEQTATPLKSDFRAAAAYVREHRLPGELLVFHISYVRDTFEYYYGDSSPASDGVPTDDHTTSDAVDAAMRERVADRPVVWLVLSEPEMWDQRGLTVAWLEEHGRPEASADFARVSVTKYRLGDNAIP
jgi:uncharacterized membrane protein